MVDDSRIVTLGSFLSLPIAKHSTLRIVTRDDLGGIKSLWVGRFIDLHSEIYHNENFHVYTEVKLISMGNGNQNAIIMI